MPEGDTIYRAARTLDRALAGRVVTRFETVLPQLERVNQDAPVAGRTVESVRPAGKWCLMRFSGDLILVTHMRMNGSWHIYRRGERWQRARVHMRVVIATAEFIAVGFEIPVAEFHTARSLARHAQLKALGPDLLGEKFDQDEVRRRMEALSDQPIEEVLLNQSVMAGIGNEFKSEILFACGIRPDRLAGALSRDEVERLICTSRRLLRANVKDETIGVVTYSGYRRTTGNSDRAARLWVYGRARGPCRRCGAAVHYRKSIKDGRSTYWCPRCQV
jgi:endonuclease-8